MFKRIGQKINRAYKKAQAAYERHFAEAEPEIKSIPGHCLFVTDLCMLTCDKLIKSSKEGLKRSKSEYDTRGGDIDRITQAIRTIEQTPLPEHGGSDNRVMSQALEKTKEAVKAMEKFREDHYEKIEIVFNVQSLFSMSNALEGIFNSDSSNRDDHALDSLKNLLLGLIPYLGTVWEGSKTIDSILMQKMPMLEAANRLIKRWKYYLFAAYNWCLIGYVVSSVFTSRDELTELRSILDEAKQTLQKKIDELLPNYSNYQVEQSKSHEFLDMSYDMLKKLIDKRDDPTEGDI